jgi:DNA-binding CsgD family transcriptional regulator
LLRKELMLTSIFSFFLIVSAVDLAADVYEGVEIAHIVRESIFILASLAVLVWLIGTMLRIRRENEHLNEKLNLARQASQQAGEAIIEYRSQFNDVLTRQFSEWKLSKSEAEVGRLLLKGLSLKEIAAVRNTQEKTVRAQASSIYKKASLDGRHAFSAWFLEDIN